jgi:hypothetical protein
MRAWIAYYDDWSGFALFAEEIEALRYAVDRCMVAPVAFGVDLREGLNRA